MWSATREWPPPRRTNYDAERKATRPVGAALVALEAARRNKNGHGESKTPQENPKAPDTHLLANHFSLAAINAE